jgi:hypothetical protein
MMVREQTGTGKNLMASTWTKAALVRRKFKAGRQRQKDREITPLVAIHEACILLDDLRNAMREQSLPVEDVRVALVLMVPNAAPDRDLVHVIWVPEPEELPGLFQRVAGVGGALPLGLGVWQRDREASEAVVWTQAFLTGPDAVKALIEARKRLANDEGSGADRMTPNPGFEAGIDKTPKVERLAWAWKGAKQKVKERRLNALQAVTEGRELSDDCSEKVVKAGGNPRDVGVLLVFANPENLGKTAETVVFQHGDVNSDSLDLKAVGKNLRNVPVGFVVCVLGRENGLYITSARPLLLDARALSLLDAIALSASELKNWKTS